MPPFFFFFTCAPPFETLKKKEKKKVSDSARLYPGCYLPPPDVDGALKKKSVGVPPPPPPLISFFGTCANFEAGGGPKKRSMLCPPFLKFLDPPLLLKLQVHGRMVHRFFSLFGGGGGRGGRLVLGYGLYRGTGMWVPVSESGAEPGFSWGGGAQKIICAHAHYERESLTAGVLI